MLLLLFLILLFLSGISTVVFLILFFMKKKHAVIGLSISGGILLFSLVASVISGSVSFLNWANTIDENIYEDDYPDELYEEESLTTDEDFDEEFDELMNDMEAFEEKEVALSLKLDGKDKVETGNYKVGDDIPAGEYVVFGGEYGSIRVTKDNSEDPESMIVIDTIRENHHRYVAIKKGNYVKLDDTEMYPADAVPPLKPEDGIYRNGSYKVGQDIPAGEYKVLFDGDEKNTDSGRVIVSKSPNDDYDEEVLYESVKTNAYVTLEDGQYVVLDRVYIDINK